MQKGGSSKFSLQYTWVTRLSHLCFTASLQLVYVAAEDFIPEIESSVTVLQDFFTTRRDAYYRDALFFFSLFLHRLLPGLERIMLMDIDIKVSWKCVVLKFSDYCFVLLLFDYVYVFGRKKLNNENLIFIRRI